MNVAGWEASFPARVDYGFNKMAKSQAFRWVVLVAALLAGGGYFGWRHYRAPRSELAQDASKGVAPKNNTVVPVTVAAVEKTDFPIYLDGLGTVQGFNTVVVRTRVDGQVDNIAFKEGQLVNKGDLLAQIDPRPFRATLNQAKAKKDQDEASLANAKLDLNRYTRLGEFATRQQLDTQRSTVQQLTAQIEADDAAVANTQTQLDYTTIRAPITGITGFRQVDQGNIVNAATQTGIVTIAQIEPIAVIFTAPEEQLVNINDSLAAGPLQVIALTSDGKRKLSEGLLTVVNNQVDSTSGTVRLKAIFDNKDHVLWPGLAVATRLLVKTLKGAIVAPDDAVRHGADGLYALTVNQNNQAEIHTIRAGPSINGRTVIEDGLNAGQQVIVAGQYRVQPGSTVTTRVATSTEAPVKAD